MGQSLFLKQLNYIIIKNLTILKLKEINDIINELDFPIIAHGKLNQYWLIVDGVDMLKSLTLREAFTNWLISFYVFNKLIFLPKTNHINF